ncbi:glycosyltransferase family 4 protein [Virgibacillus halodenitrificans]|uniref:glycosyltransferase family 4 protein n=1 Tax=Virgibacillus halodenitrificans TaxID=1482 RepID=UPI00045D23BF|nr:glycosyltransferase family 4 protein [Virgibacillus halodenitrificans]CDQ31409.1 Glycogen synthase [Virgibacillus halodenitrificans]
MKILNINSYYLSSTLYKPMEDSLNKIGLELTTYVPVYHGYKGREEITLPLAKHVKVSQCFNKNDRLFFYLKHNKIKKDFFNQYNVKDYDILHAHSLFSNGYIAYRAYKKYQIPYVVAVRSTDINVFFKKMVHLRSLGLKILLNAKTIIFLSESHKEECISNYVPNRYKRKILIKTTVIPNGIDDFWFINKRRESLRVSNQFVKLIFVGDDSKRKNLSALIDTCDILINQKFKVELRVAGKISDEKKEQLEKKEYIKFIGKVNKDKLLMLYRQSDIFVLPSINETFGLVYAEAMSQGLPVLYTKGQGFDNQFNEGVVGYHVIANKPEDIANKVTKILKNYEQVSANCIELSHKFKWENISTIYFRIYQNPRNVTQ